MRARQKIELNVIFGINSRTETLIKTVAGDAVNLSDAFKIIGTSWQVHLHWHWTGVLVRAS